LSRERSSQSAMSGSFAQRFAARIEIIIPRAQSSGTHERIRLEPVPAGRVTPVDHDDVDVRRRVEERIGERHPRRAAADDEVVRLQRPPPHGAGIVTGHRRGGQQPSRHAPVATS
jgi:hypothetical protein